MRSLLNREHLAEVVEEVVKMPLVRTNQLGNRLGRLRLVRDERIDVHAGHDLRITTPVIEQWY